MSTARRLENITLADIRDVLGQNGKKSNGNWLFQCPICQDSSCDNLIVKGNGAYVHCFSCANNEGGKYILTEIEKKRAKQREKDKKQQIINEKPKFLYKKVQEEYLEKQYNCEKYLSNNKELLDLLYEKRGIDRQTVLNCGIGFDKEKEEWTLPLISLSYDLKLMGFEYRRKNFDLYPAWKEGDKQNKVRRDSGYVSDVCIVYGCSKAETLYIMEGFWDSYCIHQYLRNKGRTDYTIYSCSNGVSSLLNVMNRITFADFGEVKLILDADNAGSKVTDDIISKFPFIKDKRNFLFKGGYKDTNEWLLATQEGI